MQYGPLLLEAVPGMRESRVVTGAVPCADSVGCAPLGRGHPVRPGVARPCLRPDIATTRVAVSWYCWHMPERLMRSWPTSSPSSGRQSHPVTSPRRRAGNKCQRGRPWLRYSGGLPRKLRRGTAVRLVPAASRAREQGSTANCWRRRRRQGYHRRCASVFALQHPPTLPGAPFLAGERGCVRGTVRSPFPSPLGGNHTGGAGPRSVGTRTN